jgi:murein DD-endopeptidase MepM/ murein hydrolase activator NlpD
VVANLFIGIRKVVFGIVVSAGLLGANPALANSSSNADIAAPLRAAQATKPSPLGSGDEEFRRLFASWKSIEQSPVSINASTPAAPIRRSGVSIPSLNPLNGSALTSGFGMRTHPVLGGRRGHKGIDLSSPTGTPIRATADGVVNRADWFSSYGLFVSLEHGGQIETRYGHMSRLNVAPGQQVKKGDIIGYVGSTGRSTGPHLHYEVRIAGTAVNPVPYMQGTLERGEGGLGGE